MLQLKSITKTYRTGDLVQVALNQVSLNFRDNEFVSILGQSGSGKTTMLNIIGGLDRYESGDLIINGISTNKYKERDWDNYRNHTIGFVFQSYNLIPHQSVLANVELALTIAGISGKEKRERAKAALEKVGLGDQLHKKPAQLSGGQMQRVAVARALVNDPDILLADEPTGALDTATSIQVMDLLKEVAKDKLVIMVTHNPELAERYSTRIVKLKDGVVVDDTHPYRIEENVEAPILKSEEKKTKKASMSFTTALALSFQNLRTKKGRTFLTSFAGSIGIIGIALILALSTGVNTYIDKMQRDTMSSYPIVIEQQTLDLGGNMMKFEAEDKPVEKSMDKIYSDGANVETVNEVSSTVAENDLRSFKRYLDNKDGEIWNYIGSNGVTYTYNTPCVVYTYDEKGTLVNTDGSGLIVESGNNTRVEDDQMGISMEVDSTSSLAQNIFTEITGNVIKENYDVIYGAWPENKNQVVLVVDENNQLPLEVLYQMGMKPASEFQKLIDEAKSKKNFKAPAYDLSFEELCKQKFYLVSSCDFYSKTDDNKFELIDSNSKEGKALAEKGIELEITGIIKIKEDATSAVLNGYVAYTHELTEYLIDYANDSEVVKAQLASKNVNVLDGEKISEESYQASLQRMGYVERENPLAISIYTDNFEAKEAIIDCIDNYNKAVDKEQKIVYTDLVELMMSSVTTIVDVVSYILIAFVAISLIVSSLMIGIITYISVLERRKEIGILRAVGASRRNIKNVFNAETVLVGAAAGVIGIAVSEVFILIINAIIRVLTADASMSASLPFVDMLILIVLSIFLTFIGGLVPAGKAAKADPVEALRSE